MRRTDRISRLVAQLALEVNRKDDASPRLGELFEHYIAHARVHYKSWRNMERTYNNYLLHWADMPVSKMTRSTVKDWHASLGVSISHTTANRALELLRAIINRAIDWDLCPYQNPATGIKRFRLQARERFLTVEELSRLFAALNTLRYDTTRDALLISLLTGQRRGNVVAMRWDEINWHRATWRIPVTKNGTSHLIPLVAEVIAILKTRKERNAGKSEWVFPSSRSPSAHLTKPEAAWRAIVERAQLKDARIHDLRRTLASYQAITGSNISVIAWTLNHKDLSSTQIYARLNVEPVRTSVESATHYMLEHAGVNLEKDRSGFEIESFGPAFKLGDQRLLTEDEAALMMNTTVDTLQMLRYRNEGPPYVKLGFSLRYEASVLTAWMRGRNVGRSHPPASM